MTTTKRPDGTIGVLIGLTRCGKSSTIKEALPQHQRILVLDPKNQYGAQMGAETFHDRADFLERVIDSGNEPCFLAYVPKTGDDFAFFCDVAFNWIRVEVGCLVIEELAQFAGSGKAAASYGVLINQVLEYGATILATVQRGQEVDKTIMNSATYLQVMHHGTDSDAMYIAQKLGCDVSEIPREKLKFLHWNPQKLIICKGSISYKNDKPTFKIAGNRIVKVEPDGTIRGQKYR